jgi:hypothetical protein
VTARYVEDNAGALAKTAHIARNPGPLPTRRLIETERARVDWRARVRKIEQAEMPRDRDRRNGNRKHADEDKRDQTNARATRSWMLRHRSRIPPRSDDPRQERLGASGDIQEALVGDGIRRRDVPVDLHALTVSPL